MVRRLNIIVSLIVLVITAHLAAFTQAVPKAEYDRFTDISTVSAYLHIFNPEDKSKDSFDVIAVMTFVGKEPKGIESFVLRFEYPHLPADGIFLSNKAYILADEKRFEIPLRYPPKSAGTLRLIVEVPLDPAALRAIANSRTVEIRAANVEQHSFSEADLNILRSLIKAGNIPSESMAAPASKPKWVSSFREVSTDPVGFVDVPVKTNGSIRLNDWYSGEYKNARETHFAFTVYDLGETFRAGSVYMLRGPKAERLRKLLLSDSIDGLTGTFVFMIRKDRFKSNQSIFTAELLDYGPTEHP